MPSASGFFTDLFDLGPIASTSRNVIDFQSTLGSFTNAFELDGGDFETEWLFIDVGETPETLLASIALPEPEAFTVAAAPVVFDAGPEVADDMVLMADAGTTTLEGGAGDDILSGTDGMQALQGGGGNDTIFGGSGSDLISGGTGNDLLFGEDGDDLIDGGTGNDNLRGGDGNDFIVGGDGADKLVGGTGEDLLRGGAGDDVLTGGKVVGGDSERDEFAFVSVANGGGGFDRITDFEDGIDKIDLSGTDYTTFEQVQLDAIQLGAGVQINLEGAATVLIETFALEDLRADDFLF